jgi:hypothetical protein
MGGLVDRRRFLAISGARLLAIVAQYLDGTAGRGQYTPRMTSSLGTDPLVDQVEQHLPMLQLLDAQHGGARQLSTSEHSSGLSGFLEGGHSPAVASRLIRALAEIGQLAGWMAFDAADHGLAQRYFVTALRAAHQVNDLPLCAHILGDLSFQAASRGHPADAIALGEAARRASDAAPLAVRASILPWLAYAYATAVPVCDQFAGSATGVGEVVVTARRIHGLTAKRRWLMIMCADHGDAFGEDGYYGRGIVYPTVLNVPFAAWLSQ